MPICPPDEIIQPEVIPFGMLGQFHLQALREASAKTFLDFRRRLRGYDPCGEVDKVRHIFEYRAVALYRSLLFVAQVVLFVIILKGPTQPCDVLRHGTKRGVL